MREKTHPRTIGIKVSKENVRENVRKNAYAMEEERENTRRQLFVMSNQRYKLIEFYFIKLSKLIVII